MIWLNKLRILRPIEVSCRCPTSSPCKSPVELATPDPMVRVQVQDAGRMVRARAVRVALGVQVLVLAVSTDPKAGVDADLRRKDRRREDLQAAMIAVRPVRVQVRKALAPRLTVRTTVPAHRLTVRTTDPAHRLTVRTTDPAHKLTVRTTDPAHRPTDRTTAPARKAITDRKVTDPAHRRMAPRDMEKLSSCCHGWNIRPRHCCERSVICEPSSAADTTDAVPIDSEPKEGARNVRNSVRPVEDRSEAPTHDPRVRHVVRKVDDRKVRRISIVA